MSTGTTEDIDYFKNAPSDATHYVCVGGRYRYLKESHHPNGDVFVIENWGKGWLPNSHICGTTEEYIERQSRNNTRILASRSLKEEQDWEWQYLKGSKEHFKGVPEEVEIICKTYPHYYKKGKDGLTYSWSKWYGPTHEWTLSMRSIAFGEEGSYSTTFPVLAVRRKVKTVKEQNKEDYEVKKIVNTGYIIKSTPTEDKTVQEFQNGQEVMWHKGRVFYVGESKEKGKSVIETLTNQGIHGTTYTQVTVNTASLSIVENKQEIQQKDLKQLKELLDSEINNWFNKLS